jgi:hypothetical protein
MSWIVGLSSPRKTSHYSYEKLKIRKEIFRCSLLGREDMVHVWMLLYFGESREAQGEIKRLIATPLVNND